MGRHLQKGFTIIETMLVLAITALLVGGLLVGFGASISVQRYKDSVTTLKSLVQSQYAQAESVTNDRDKNWSCDATARPSRGSTPVADAGQTDCVVLGRYMTIVGTDIASSTVIGFKASNNTATNDVQSITSNYTLGVPPGSIETTSLEWGAQITSGKSGPDIVSLTPRAFSMLIVRSPDSGTFYTFTSNTAVAPASVSSSALKAMMVLGPTIPGQAPRTLCIDVNEGPVKPPIPETMSLFIGATASGPGAIEVRVDTMVPNGGTKCDS